MYKLLKNIYSNITYTKHRFLVMYAGICENPDRKNHYFGSRSIRYDRKCKSQDPRPGIQKYPACFSKVNVLWKGNVGWPYFIRLPYPKRIHNTLGITFMYTDRCKVDREI